MNRLKLAIAGFRHSHIFDLHQRVLDREDLDLVATCEEDIANSLLSGGDIKLTHQSFPQMLAQAACDIVALGDVYGKRGEHAIAALEAGRHVIADKPLCTSLPELERIEALARERGLAVGVMLDVRDHPNYRAMREILLSGRIGEVQSISVLGLHPLMHGKRPEWYFEPGMHGGTLNDIAIHALDLIPWMSGLEISGIDCARTWNAKASFAPHFADCGQFVLRLSNGGGVLGDVSYLAPDGSGFALSSYWRVTVHGTRGFAETHYQGSGVTVADDTNKEPELVPPAPARPGGYLDDFLACVRGNIPSGGLDTSAALSASRHALQLQATSQFHD